MKKEFSILYVDDEESNLRIFKDTFRREFNIYTALSAQEGLDMLNEVQIDLILSDQRMPNMTGVEFLIKTLETHPKPNRILITGYSDFTAIEDAINKARVFQYVQKPWKKNDLQHIIDKALQIYKLENENQQQKQELIKAKQKAESSNILITKFLQNMSHEVRTPMNAIVGFSQLLSSPHVSADDQKEFIKHINDSSNQLLKIIEDILEISRIETFQTKIISRKISLNHLVDDIYANFKLKAAGKNLEFIFDKALSDEETTIHSDPFKIEKILSNLIDNAIKFTSEGYVKIFCQHHESSISVYIEDTGIGIQPENREIIFERFSRFEEKDSETLLGGLGLGLSIAKEFATLINGSLQLLNDTGKTIFEVKLPKQLSIKEEKIPEEQNVIVIIEPEEVNWSYLEILLNSIDYPITKIRALNENEALSVCECNPNVKLVINDLTKLKAHQVKSVELYKTFNVRMKVIAQIMDRSEETISLLKQHGFDDYINKPFSKLDLMEIIEKYVLS